MVRKTRKTQRRQRKQQGGGWGFDGPAFAPAGGMAPESARAVTDDCAVLDRPAPAVTPTGAWSQAGGNCSSCAILAPTQNGGGFLNLLGLGDASANNMPLVEEADGGVAIPVQGGGRRKNHRKSRKGRKGRKQHGGGGGGGGYGFQLNNDLGKVYANLPVGPCPSAPQRGGGVTSLGDAALVSYPAGYGYAPASAMEVGDGTAHFLAQIPYGKQCMGGGRRTRRREARRKNKKSRRNHH